MSLAVAMDGERDVRGAGSARRRRERRLRCMLRHERQTVAMALAEQLHHSANRVERDAALRRQTTRASEVEERELHDAPRRQKPPPPGTRPAPLVEVQPQGAMVQHSGIGFELVQALDVPVLQMVEQPVDVDSFFRISVPAVAEQVIEVPKLALPVRAVQRAALSEPQLVEQLVEVPTVLSYSLLQQRTAEQIIDFPVPGRGGGARGRSSRFSPKDRVPQCLPVSRPSFLLVEVFKVFPKDRVPQRLPESRPSFLSRGGLHGLPQRQGSTASAGEQTIVVDRGGLQGFPRGQGSTASAVEQTIVVDRLQGFPEDRVPQRLPLSRLFPRLLIDRCHEPRLMAVMTSGCAWLMWRTTASTSGTGWTTLRAGGCRGESSTAGACSPLASTGMSCRKLTTGFFPLSDHVQMLCILAGMDQKDTYAVGYFGGDDASRAVFFFRCQVKMLCISASMEQKDSYASVAYARLVCWLRCAPRGSLLFAARPRCLASQPVSSEGQLCAVASARLVCWFGCTPRCISDSVQALAVGSGTASRAHCHLQDRPRCTPLACSPFHEVHVSTSGVLTLGYVTNAGAGYWKVLDSWGSSWC